MLVSDNAVKLIKSFEGFSAKRYLCAAGKLTIGYGHVIQPGETIAATLTESDATALLLNDINTRFAGPVFDLVRVRLTQNQFDALVSFAFNCGVTALRTSTLLRKLNAGDYEGAAAEFSKWDKVKGVALAGLTRRRQAERELFTGKTKHKS